MVGVHITGDFHECQGSVYLLCNPSGLRDLCLDAVKSAGLTVVDSLFHQFDQDGDDQAGVTGTVLLAESHLTLHTWPELFSVTLDVYVCNFLSDNTDKAGRLFDQLLQTFQPASKEIQVLTRGQRRRSGVGLDSAETSRGLGQPVLTA